MRASPAAHDIGLVARREITTRLRQKGYLIGALVVVVIVLLVAILPGLLQGNGGATTYDVGLVGQDSASLAPSLRVAGDLPGIDADVRVHTEPDGAAARSAVRHGHLDAALVGDTVIVDKGLSTRLATVLTQALRAQQVDRAVASGQVDRATADRLTGTGLYRLEKLHRSNSPSDRRRALAFAGIIILYGQLLWLGVGVAMGVVEEKSSRVVEVLLSAITPNRLLAGKIIGIGLIGLAQLLVTAAIGLIGASAAGTMTLPPGWWWTLVTVVGWFVLGYAFYSCVFAMAGSLVSRQEELQGVQTPITFLVVLSFLAGQVAFASPSNAIAVVTSFLPPSAPLVIPLRLSAGVMPAWQAAISVLLTVAAGLALVRLAGRVYAGSALRVRGRVGLREALRPER